MLDAVGLTFSFGDQVVLQGASLSVDSGESVALIGASGSGKSTFLHLLSGILIPESGTVDLMGNRISALSSDERAAIRLRHLGFVFQSSDLLPELTLRENIELPNRLLRNRNAAREVNPLLERLGIAGLANNLPSAVSGGERQRAALARALAHRPQIVLADEPTGALDQANGNRVIDELLTSAKEFGAAVVVVTHDSTVASQMSRIVTISDGATTP